MEFETTPEWSQLRDAVRRAVGTHATESQIRSAMESPGGFDTDLWKTLSVDLGLTTMFVPGADGRTPGRFADLAAALEELGRGPVCAPILGTAVLAPALLTACAGRLAHELLARLAEGEIRATAALETDAALEGNTHSASGTALAATERDGEFVLDGVIAFVVDAPGADLLLLPARIDDSFAIFAVEGGAAGLTVGALATMDQTRAAARLELADTPAGLVARGPSARAAWDHARLIALTALAAEQVGGAARCLELTVAYVEQRRQFGVPIGSFQAVKHICADMLVAVEFARSAAEYAAYCVDQQPDDLPTAARVAASLCAESYLDVAEATIQLHGGIGFTWDNYAHLYFKRAKSSALMFGQPVAQRTELAELLGL